MRTQWKHQESFHSTIPGTGTPAWCHTSVYPYPCLGAHIEYSLSGTNSWWRRQPHLFSLLPSALLPPVAGSQLSVSGSHSEQWAPLGYCFLKAWVLRERLHFQMKNSFHLPIMLLLNVYFVLRLKYFYVAEQGVKAQSCGPSIFRGRGRETVNSRPATSGQPLSGQD